MLRYCPHKRDNLKNIHNIEESTTIDVVVRIIPKFYATVEDHQVDHQSVVIKVGGNISKKSLSILIDMGSNRNYVTPRVVETCSLEKCKHSKSWLVQLAMGTKKS